MDSYREGRDMEEPDMCHILSVGWFQKGKGKKKNLGEG